MDKLTLEALSIMKKMRPATRALFNEYLKALASNDAKKEKLIKKRINQKRNRLARKVGVRHA